MIMEYDFQSSQTLCQHVGGVTIMNTGRGVATRMIMNKKEPARVEHEGFPHNVRQGKPDCARRANIDHFIHNELTPGVQIEDPRPFLPGEGHGYAHVIDNRLRMRQCRRREIRL